MTCATCSGPYQNNCLTCIPGYKLLEGRGICVKDWNDPPQFEPLPNLRRNNSL